MTNSDRSLDERVSSLETAVSTIGRNVEHIATKVDSITRTPWSHVIGFAGIILTLVGSAYIIYNRDQERTEKTLFALDSNLQREQRQLDDRIIEQINGLRALNDAKHASADARISGLEDRLDKGFNERWSKADHVEYDHVVRERNADLLRRIERLEEFHLKSDK